MAPVWRRPRRRRCAGGRPCGRRDLGRVGDRHPLGSSPEIRTARSKKVRARISGRARNAAVQQPARPARPGRASAAARRRDGARRAARSRRGSARPRRCSRSSRRSRRDSRSASACCGWRGRACPPLIGNGSDVAPARRSREPRLVEHLARQRARSAAHEWLPRRRSRRRREARAGEAERAGLRFISATNASHVPRDALGERDRRVVARRQQQAVEHRRRRRTAGRAGACRPPSPRRRAPPW